jgi:YD repeat-containing protein
MMEGGVAVTTTWDYDNAHRLVTETLGGIVTTFAYDDAGNRVTEVNNASMAGSSAAYTYDHDGRGKQCPTFLILTNN